MNKKERQQMIEVYANQFKYYNMSGSDFEKLQLNGMREMMKLFFTDKEINTIENHVRVEKEYQREYFEVIESWLKQINKEINVQELLFSWDNKGLNNVYQAYDYLFNDYKGLKLAIENTMNLLERVA